MKFSYETLTVPSGTTSLDTSEYQYLFVLNGSGTLCINETTIDFNSHDLLECPLNQNIQIICKKSISFGKLVLDDFHIVNTTFKHYTSERTELARLTFLYALELSGINHPLKNRIMNSMNQIMGDIVLTLPHSLDVQSPVVYAIIDRINTNYTNPDFVIGKNLSIDEHSDSYIRRVFLKSTGVTPLEFLNNVRLEAAKKLLISETDTPISVISEQCGFKDPYYFSRFFKKKTGVTPSQYRKNK